MNGTFFRALGLVAFGGFVGLGAAGCSIDLGQVMASALAVLRSLQP